MIKALCFDKDAVHHNHEAEACGDSIEEQEQEAGLQNSVQPYK